MDNACLYAVLSGVLLGFVYDVFRFFRLLFNDKFVLDFLYCVLSSVVVFCYLIVFSNGNIRIIYIISIFIGFVMYILTIGRLTVKAEIFLSKKVKIWLKKLKKVLQFIYNIYYNIKVKIIGLVKAFFNGVKYDKRNNKKE